MSQAGVRHISWQVTDPSEWAAAEIRIDGLPFIELVKQYEESRGYRPAGGYGYCPVGRTLPPSRHFLGEAAWGPSTANPRVSLLLCECRNVGCWDFRGAITLTPDRVVWSNFEQIYRHWNYDGFGPFEFDRTQYENALAAARSAT
jgi:hypothetical protein